MKLESEATAEPKAAWRPTTEGSEASDSKGLRGD